MTRAERHHYWTPRQDNVLRSYAATGQRASVCAKAMRVSRNAVIGRAWRLGVRFAGGRTDLVAPQPVITAAPTLPKLAWLS